MSQEEVSIKPGLYNRKEVRRDLNKIVYKIVPPELCTPFLDMYCSKYKGDTITAPELEEVLSQVSNLLSELGGAHLAKMFCKLEQN
jgi:hypothetical protein